MSNFDMFFDVIDSNFDLVVVSAFGGLVLFGFKLIEHFNREQHDKMPLIRYIGFFVFLLITLPMLGLSITLIYLMNGDEISVILAFQIGITSPAIIQKIITSTADGMSKSASPSLSAGQ